MKFYIIILIIFISVQQISSHLDQDYNQVPLPAYYKVKNAIINEDIDIIPILAKLPEHSNAPLIKTIEQIMTKLAEEFKIRGHEDISNQLQTFKYYSNELQYKLMGQEDNIMTLIDSLGNLARNILSFKNTIDNTVNVMEKIIGLHIDQFDKYISKLNNNNPTVETIRHIANKLIHDYEAAVGKLVPEVAKILRLAIDVVEETIIKKEGVHDINLEITYAYSGIIVLLERSKVEVELRLHELNTQLDEAINYKLLNKNNLEIINLHITQIENLTEREISALSLEIYNCFMASNQLNRALNKFIYY